MPIRVAAPAPRGRELVDRNGRVLARFSEGQREGHPLADLLEPADGVEEGTLVAAVARELRGWILAAAPGLAGRLIADGARPVRHAHVMRLELPVAQDPAAPVPTGVRIEPLGDRTAQELAPAFMAAYPPGHLDFRPGEDELPVAVRSLETVVADPELWPVLPCSRVALDAEGDVIGAAVIVENPPQPPFGGPWVAELFRMPGHRGVGAALLRSALEAASADGLATVELAVTEGNGARGLYEAFGFRVVVSTMSVLLADR